jgi:predicted phosphodiesterase
MKTQILIISDIHGNWPALSAVAAEFPPEKFDAIINCGDSLVYAPFPNETLTWLQQNKALSILGNTDKKVKKILKGKTLKKPRKMEKRIMYEHTAGMLTARNRRYLRDLPKARTVVLGKEKGPKDHQEDDFSIGVFHGSPAEHHEFIFAHTPEARFKQLAALTSCGLVVTGHSHSPYHKLVDGVHFVNPGSVGRMFDSDPRASCATVTITGKQIRVQHFRVDYDIDAVVREIRGLELPEIYCTMFWQGKKLN